ncbi:MAG: hypothetical protein LBT58_00340 [Endomicrobium sp.]|jgi:hypothetical protein|nr:hypothetical protein [Endomicrobium sp.]
MGFYETIITIFSIMICFVLGIDFIYMRNVSKSEVNKVVEEAMNDAFFKSFLKEQLENVFKLDTKDGMLASFLKTNLVPLKVCKSK